jgi:hypothetical protein
MNKTIALIVNTMIALIALGIILFYVSRMLK